MSQVQFFSKDNAPNILEGLVDIGTKSLDVFNLFEDDGLLSSIPYGKFVKYFANKIIQISDVDKALTTGLNMAGFITFNEACKKYKINPYVELVEIKKRLLEIKASRKDVTYKLDNFDLKDFSSNNSVKEITSVYHDIISQYISTAQKIALDRHFKNYYKHNFLVILENHSIVFEYLLKKINSGSHEESIEIFKRESYELHLKSMYSDVVLNDSNGMALCDIYIEPSSKIHVYSTGYTGTLSGAEFAENKGFTKIKGYESKSAHDYVHDIFKNHSDRNTSRLVFLLGYPGQGKSSFCKKLLFDHYEGLRDLGKQALLIKFRTLVDTQNLVLRPLSTLYDYLKNNLRFNLTQRVFDNSILILDGLDEFYMKENLSENSIDEFCRALERELEVKPNMRVLVTSRYGYISLEKFKSKTITILQLTEFSLLQQKEWLKKYKLFHPETLLTEKKINLYNEKGKFSYIREMICQPIILHLIATIKVEIKEHLDRASIYRSLIEEMISRSWSSDGQIDLLKGLTPDDLRSFLRSLAFEIFKTGKEYIHRSVLENLETTGHLLSKLENQQFKNIAKRIMVAFYFQESNVEQMDMDREKSNYAIEFLHRSFKEYLVAENIWYEIQEFVDYNERTGKFLIDDQKEAFVKVYQLFSYQPISSEIRKYLREISNQSNVGNVKLADRLSCFLKIFLDNSFIQIDLLKQGSYPIHLSAQLFSSYWYLLRFLQQERNYLIDQTLKDSFSRFISLTARSIEFIDLGNQDLRNCTFVHVDISRNLTKCNFKTVFEKCTLNEITIEGVSSGNSIRFENCTLSNIRFQNFIGTLEINHCNLNFITFENCSISSLNIRDTSMYNSSINKSSISACKIQQSAIWDSKGVIDAIDSLMITNSFPENVKSKTASNVGSL